MTELDLPTIPVGLLSPLPSAEFLPRHLIADRSSRLIISLVNHLDDILTPGWFGDQAAVLVDARFGHSETSRLIERIQSAAPNLPVVLILQQPAIDQSMAHLYGRADVLTPLELSQGLLPRVIRHAIEFSQAAAEERRLKELVRAEHDKTSLIERELAFLLTTIRRISSAAEASVTIDRILDAALELVACDSIGLAVIGPTGTDVRFEAARGVGADLIAGVTIPMGEGLTGTAARSNAAILVNDAAGDLAGLNPELVTICALRSGLFVPLSAGSRHIGVLVGWSQRSGFFEKRHEATLGNLAEHVGLVIEQARSRAEFDLAQAALRRSEEEFHLIIQNSSDVIVVLDEDARIRFVSPSIERLIGYNPGELRDQIFFDFLDSDDRGMAMSACRTAAATPGTAEYVDLRAPHHDGTTRTLAVAITNLVDQPAVAGIVMNIRDVTDHYRLADQLRQSQKLEAIGRLAAGVAHDFNNLLTVINGFSQMIVAETPPLDPRRGHADQIVAAGNSAATLTRQLLAFSRQQVLSPRVVDLNAIIRSTDAMLRPILGEDIELSIDLASELGEVVADPGQVEQAIVNLALHARARMPTGGKLTIRTENIDGTHPVVRAHPGARPIQQVLLSVSDTGPPIDDLTRTKIFEPFLPTEGGSGGTGLGLAAVYGIVKQSDGDIFVSSAQNRATVFHLLFPRVDAERRPGLGTQSENPLSPVNETVLLVEDEDRVRSFVRLVLEGSGYTVLEADRGDAGLDVSRNHSGPIHALVTDIVMPGMNGRQLAEQLLLERPALKIVYMSGYTDDELIRYGVLGPSAAFIAKPFAPTTLSLTVRQVLDSG